MKIKLIAAALTAMAAPSAVQATCVNLLDNSWFEDGGSEAWFSGMLPVADPDPDYLGAGGSCAWFNDNESASGIPNIPEVRSRFQAYGGSLRNAIEGEYDLVVFGHHDSQTCRAGQEFPIPAFPIESATLKFKLRSFSDDPTGSSGDSGAALVDIVSPIAFPRDQLVHSTAGSNNVDIENHAYDITGLLQRAQEAGDTSAYVFLDSRSMSFVTYHVTIWDAVELLVCPPGSGVSGDPHFKRWNGEWYDFHGLCDMVLVSNPDFAEGTGLDIHVRSKGRSSFSYIETAAIRIGEDILEIGSWGEYFYNGVEDAELEDVKMGEKFEISHTCDHLKRNRQKKQCKFEILLGGAESITIKIYKDMVSVSVEGASEENFGSSVGMMGSFPEGKLLARDGATIMEDPLLFGQEWQIMENERQLFSSPSESVGACLPPPAMEGRRLGESSVSEEDAEKACAHLNGQDFDNCVFDVIATADLEAADMHGAF